MKLLDKQNIDQLLSGIDNVLVDCDGVIWGIGGRQQVLNNANGAINKLKSLGKKVFLVTNSDYRTTEAFLEKCRADDMDIEKESAVCAPFIMAHYLKEKEFKKKIYIIGTNAAAEELKKEGFECEGPKPENLDVRHIFSVILKGQVELDKDVGAVAVGYDPDFNYSKLVKANCYLSNPDCLLLAFSVDERFPIPNTKIYLPASGVMVKAIESASGRKATLTGKPSTLMFEVLAKKYGLVPERTLIIGDTLQTDIYFGNKCGLQTLLVLSGVSSLAEAENLKAKARNNDENSMMIPQYYLPSLGDISSLIE